MRVALSIRQPWVELILRGVKTIEVRSWTTSYRGTLWLHAGKSVERDVCAHYDVDSTELLIGGLLGWCELVDCVKFDRLGWTQLQPKHLNLGEFQSGLYAWLLEKPVREPFEAMPGRLGLMRIRNTREGARS